MTNDTGDYGLPNRAARPITDVMRAHEPTPADELREWTGKGRKPSPASAPKPRKTFGQRGVKTDKGGA